MSGSAYGLSFEEMDAAGRHVLDVNQDIQGTLSQLKGQLAPLAGAWRGSASVAFQNLMVRWDDAAQRLNHALQGIGESIQASSATYAAQEEQHSQTMSSITQSLG
jgi:WXG100 family type VII secretion target